MKSEFLTIDDYFSSELVEKKSKFIAHIQGVTSKTEAEEFFKSIRSKYKDARHNVPAFRIGIDSIDEWSNDDGEPAGTAGKPILDLIRNAELTNVAVMVTRYFGGILLGTGGLVRAYGGVTTQLLNEIPHIKKALHKRIYIETDYKNLGKVKRFLDDNALYVDMNCAQNVVFTYDILLDKLEMTKKDLTELCAGQVVIQGGDDIYITI